MFGIVLFSIFNLTGFIFVERKRRPDKKWDILFLFHYRLWVLFLSAMIQIRNKNGSYSILLFVSLCSHPKLWHVF